MKKSLIILVVMIVCCLFVGIASASYNTQTSIYEIYNEQDLRDFSSYVVSDMSHVTVNAELKASFTMSSTPFTPIGTSSRKYAGTFNGNNYAITGLVVSTSTDGAGMFWYLGSGAIIKNLKLYSCSVSTTGTGDAGTGILYGVVSASSGSVSIQNVHIYNSVVSCKGSNCGGIAGAAGNGAISLSISGCTVDNCKISCNLYDAGGICGGAGINGASVLISDCDVTGCIIQVIDTNFGSCGGICGYGAHVGSSTLTVSNCDVTNCYIYGKSFQSGGIAGFASYSSGSSSSITDCNVDKCTIITDGSYAGGIYAVYRAGSDRPIVSRCTVTDCTILALSNSGGIAGGYQAS